MLTKRSENILVFGIILILVIYFKWDFLDTPFFFEERPFTIVNIRKISLINLILGRYEPGAFAHHPILMPFSSWYTFKFSRYFTDIVSFKFVIHLFFGLISSGTLFFIYKITRVIFKRSILFSLVPSVFLFTFPDFFIQSTNYRYDIFTAFLATALIFSRLSCKKTWFLILGIFLSQSRETVIAFFVSNLLIDLYLFLSKKEDNKFYMISSFIHILSFSSFFLLNYINHGALTTSQAANEINTSISEYLNILAFDLRWLFLDDGKWILSFILLFVVVFKIRKKVTIDTSLFYVGLPIVFYCFGMAFHVFEASYYLFPVLGLVFILITCPIVMYARKTNILIVMMLWLSNSYHVNLKNNYEFLAENGTDYLKVIKNYKDTAKFMSKFKNIKVNAEWPLVDYLSSTLFGYMDDDFRFKSVEAITEGIWSRKLGHEVINKLDCDKSNFDYVIISEQAPRIKIESQLNLVKSCNYIEIKEIKNDRFLTTVYKNETL